MSIFGAPTPDNKVLKNVEMQENPVREHKRPRRLRESSSSSSSSSLSEEEDDPEHLRRPPPLPLKIARPREEPTYTELSTVTYLSDMEAEGPLHHTDQQQTCLTEIPRRPQTCLTEIPRRPQTCLTEIPRCPQTRLSQTHQLPVLISKLGVTGGTTVKKMVWRICQKVFSNQLATQLNWCGRGNKTSIKSRSVAEMLISSVRKNNNSVTKSDVEKEVKNWLQLSGDRLDGCRRQRRTQTTRREERGLPACSD
ncbi:uncharacterized protein LOC132867723 [Neoarius graeffei]|uniref:uncharacterized protein LOC132867723 n=1 Tax=Neoarius graeffei TaxID=443677 RepID=UPI00298D204A|nr:uncharacterized protein LOC132867723 [Neoarius graeffei]XP_060756721.1 uncharacterized protein LOC132867723 [Neoarius graeffei]XP_060756722.1 uncharacterized protein LOC132867723 [Neoarius graeffei]XP_060756723.1 uncharacterized protein LOC132867723 [Neoarius graeffei]XP_060756724.1 uncharacterized protein LOC132867723 [Neoarius graeffei]